jgi:serine/threonine-protein kinase
VGRLPDRRVYFTMKLVKGKTLADQLVTCKDLAGERMRLLGLVLHVSQALAYAHNRSVIHRDIKPSNIMLGNFGEVQLMDWGLAKVLTGSFDSDEPTGQEVTVVTPTADSTPSSDSETQPGEALGTPAYVSPEQARGQWSRVDARCDLGTPKDWHWRDGGLVRLLHREAAAAVNALAAE